jgi:hypothetical protein
MEGDSQALVKNSAAKLSAEQRAAGLNKYNINSIAESNHASSMIL